MPSFERECNVCHAKYNEESWRALELVGSQRYDFEADAWEKWELRNCPCGATMARLVASSEDE